MQGGLQGAASFVAGKPSPSLQLEPSTEASLRTALQNLLTTHPEVDSHQFLFAFLEGMTAVLNERHTIYLRPESWNDLKDNQRPYLGYSATSTTAGRLVWLVESGSPASDAGLRPGDTITAVNGVSLAANSGSVVPPAVIGRTDTLTVRGVDGRQRSARITATTDDSPIEARMLTGGIAYLRIGSFIPPGTNDVFISQLDDAMQMLASNRPIGWVLDLRSDGGGIVTLANYTAGWLGYQGVFAEVTARPDAREVRPYVSESRLDLAGRPAVVLVNRRTASSSEMLAKVLHDAGIARIVGEPTAGSVRLAQYHEVGGGALQIAFADVAVGPARAGLDKKGVTPDDIVDLNPADLANGIDAQLDRAISLIAGD
jgi:carboxyl-terminal processing protease